MKVSADQIEIVLRENRPLRIARARGRRIVCTAGCAWITAPGVRDDIYLNAGDAWEVDCDGLVLIEAVSSATVALRGYARWNILCCKLRMTGNGLGPDDQ